MDHEVQVQDTARANRGARARSDPTNVRVARSCDHSRSGVAGSHSHAGVGAAGTIAIETGAVHQRTVIAATAGGVSGPAEALLGQHLWGRGYFCATVGAVDEKTVQEYIENQKWDEDDQGFKVTAPTEP